MSLDPGGRLLRRRPLGRTGLLVDPLCIGTGPLDARQAYPYTVPEDEALAFIRAALEGPINFLDTGASYGDGASERRIGKVLREIGGPPPGLVLATKADRERVHNRFTGDQTRRSVERSLNLLGLERLQLCYIHDAEYTPDDILEKGGAVEALLDCKAQGVVEHVGLAMGPIDQELRYLESGEFEVVLTHNRYNLLDRTAEPLLDYAAARGIGVVNAAPYGGGILSKGPDVFPRFRYVDAPPELIERARRIQAVCARHEVPLASAALQFSLREPRISSTAVGMSRPERLAETLRFATWQIPETLWEELEPLLPPPETP